MEEVRLCKKCGEVKPLSEYRYYKKFNLYSRTCNLCLKNRNNAYMSRRYKTNRDTVRYNSRATGLRLKYEVFDMYGGKCACCGETDYRFLTIDHKNGGGRKHREEISKTVSTGGYAFYKWIKDQGYPDTLQVLCYNCNCGKQHNGGICPHQDLSFTLHRVVATSRQRMRSAKQSNTTVE